MPPHDPRTTQPHGTPPRHHNTTQPPTGTTTEPNRHTPIIHKGPMAVSIVTRRTGNLLRRCDHFSGVVLAAVTGHPDDLACLIRHIRTLSALGSCPVPVAIALVGSEDR